jgi:uncharacterized membrane protein YgcG
MNKIKVTVIILSLTIFVFSACNRNVVANKTPKQSYYTCPMHTEVFEMRPGKCPKCGMTLEQYDMDSYSQRKSSSAHSGHSGSGGGSGGCH